MIPQALLLPINIVTVRPLLQVPASLPALGLNGKSGATVKTGNASAAPATVNK